MKAWAKEQHSTATLNVGSSMTGTVGAHQQLLVMQMGFHLSHHLPVSVPRTSHVSSSSFAAISTLMGPHPPEPLLSPVLALAKWHSLQEQCLGLCKPGTAGKSCHNCSFQGWLYLPQAFCVQSTSPCTESMGDVLSQGILTCQRNSTLNGFS